MPWCLLPFVMLPCVKLFGVYSIHLFLFQPIMVGITQGAFNIQTHSLRPILSADLCGLIVIFSGIIFEVDITNYQETPWKFPFFFTFLGCFLFEMLCLRLKLGTQSLLSVGRRTAFWVFTNRIGWVRRI